MPTIEKVKPGDRVSILNTGTSEVERIVIIGSSSKIEPFTVIGGYNYVSSGTLLARFALDRPVGHEAEINFPTGDDREPFMKVRLRITEVLPPYRLE